MRTIFISVIGALLSVSLWAGDIKLYQQPRKNAKIVATVSNNQPLTLIFFSQKHPKWVKVVSQKNAETMGWLPMQVKNGINVIRLGGHDIQRIVSVQSKGHPTHAYRVIEYSGSKQLSKKQIDTIMQRFEQSHLKMQQAMHRLFDQMWRDFDMPGLLVPPMLTPTVIVMPLNITPNHQHHHCTGDSTHALEK